MYMYIYIKAQIKPEDMTFIRFRPFSLLLLYWPREERIKWSHKK